MRLSSQPSARFVPEEVMAMRAPKARNHLSADALFSLKSPSLLALDPERTAGNVQRVYGMERVPCETSLRVILDPVVPKVPAPVIHARLSLPPARQSA